MAVYIRWDPPIRSVQPVSDVEEAKRVIAQRYPRAVYGNPESDPPDVSADERIHVWPDSQALKGQQTEVAWILTAS
jgi:hypothetical protein